MAIITMLQTIQHYITKNKLPIAPARLVVGLSGGADSVALLLILQTLGYKVVAAHCNFHLRGSESDRDENFVRELCEQQGTPLHVQHFDTAGKAKEDGISIEMAARELRYKWFEELRQQTNAKAIAVAHHADDNAETLLLNLIRGTGLHGLRGMLPKNGNIIRPLLGVHRQDLLQFLTQRKQSFVTDSTNAETIYKRNKIRHEVMPLLRQLNPAIDHSLAMTAQKLAEADALCAHAVRDMHKQICEPLEDGLRIHLDRLIQQPAAGTLLHEFLTPFGLTPATISQMADNLERPTGTLYASATHFAVFHRGTLEVRQRPTTCPTRTLPTEGYVQLSAAWQLHIRPMPYKALSDIPRQRHEVALAAEKLTGPLILRHYEESDRFQPFGMKGTKLVSDYLTDKHRSLIDKMAACVISDSQGIVWLVNERPSQRVAVNEDTKDVVLITLERIQQPS